MNIFNLQMFLWLIWGSRGRRIFCSTWTLFYFIKSNIHILICLIHQIFFFTLKRGTMNSLFTAFRLTGHEICNRRRKYVFNFVFFPFIHDCNWLNIFKIKGGRCALLIIIPNSRASINWLWWRLMISK